MSSENSEPEKEKKVFELPIVRTMPAGHTERIANHFVVQIPNPHEVHVLFYYLRPPVLVGNAEQILEQAQEYGHIEARCVGEFVIAASRFEEFAELIERQRLKLKEGVGKEDLVVEWKPESPTK